MRVRSVFVHSVIIALLTLLVSGCNSSERTYPKFSIGQFVRSKVSSQVGQIVAGRVWCRSVCFYDVRFAVLGGSTDTHLIAPDGPISVLPLAIVRDMQEYELEALDILIVD